MHYFRVKANYYHYFRNSYTRKKIVIGLATCILIGLIIFSKMATTEREAPSLPAGKTQLVKAAGEKGDLAISDVHHSSLPEPLDLDDHPPVEPSPTTEAWISPAPNMVTRFPSVERNDNERTPTAKLVTTRVEPGHNTTSQVNVLHAVHQEAQEKRPVPIRNELPTVRKKPIAHLDMKNELKINKTLPPPNLLKVKNVAEKTSKLNTAQETSLNLSQSKNRTENRKLFRNHFLRWDMYKAPPIGKDTFKTDSTMLPGSLKNNILENMPSSINHTSAKDILQKVSIFAERQKKGDASNKYLIYRCDGETFGCEWADMVNDVLFSYLLANLTQRTFKAQFLKKKCVINDYIIPNKYNWSTVGIGDFSSGQRKDQTLQLDDINVDHKTNFSTLLGDKRFVYFSPHQSPDIRSLQKLVMYRSHLAWMENLKFTDIYAGLYKRLFKLSHLIQLQVEDFISRHLLTPKHKLICVNLHSEGQRSIHEIDNNDLNNVWSFINAKSLSEAEKVFIMSGSDVLIESAKTQGFKHEVLTIPAGLGEAWMYTSSDKSCQKFQKILLELHVLMNCNVLVVNDSRLSKLAASVRGSDEGLFCIMKYGKVMPCTRENILGVVSE